LRFGNMLNYYSRPISIVPEIEVARKAELRPGQPTPGILREKAFEAREVLVSKSTVAGAVVSDWHHHGARHLYGFLISGRLRLEFGRKGKDGVDLNPGDFFHIPPWLVHRDVNLSRRRKVMVANILVGAGPPLVNVDGPDP
jgi:quercetin dioxygenase-like cupin family protein